MRLHDDGRELLTEFMKNKKISHRKMAAIADYDSHSYIGRLLDPDDPARTVSTDAGTRIAAYFGLRPDRFFVTEVSFSEGRNVPKKRTQVRRAVQQKGSSSPEKKVA